MDIACQAGHTSVATLLLDRGAKLERRNFVSLAGDCTLRAKDAGSANRGRCAHSDGWARR